MAWTHFSDRFSGGKMRTTYEDIYIELPEKEAAEYFQNLFDLSPYGEYCECCGDDYYIREMENIYHVAKDNNTLIIPFDKLDKAERLSECR